MSSCYGENIHLSIFGQSHSEAIGMTLDGLPAGLRVDLERLNSFLARRAPGNSDLSTPRKEADLPEFLSGLTYPRRNVSKPAQDPEEAENSGASVAAKEGIASDTPAAAKEAVTCGAPVAAIIRNTNTKSSDYSGLKRTPRPGHADYTAEIKYNGAQDYAGGGHFSGRLTAPMCIAGGMCLQFLENEGIRISSRIYSIGNIKDDEQQMRELILAKKAEGDSVGGIIECVITGLPAGLGDPMFDGMENRIARAVFAIPAVKGIEFGAGFEASRMTGSENNDPFTVENGKVVTAANNCGGILGGITDGMPLVFRAAFKPTPSIAKEQKTVDLETMQETTLQVHGRHDPCIVPRALPCVEAAAALAVYDALLGRRKEK